MESFDRHYINPWLGALRMAPASAKTRNDATGYKNPAFGGAYRLPGCVAMLARCDSIALRTAPNWEADTPHQIVSVWSDSALTFVRRPARLIGRQIVD